MRTLKVIDKDFNSYGEVPLYESLQIRTRYTGIGEIDLVVNRYLPNVDALQMNRIIFLDDDLSNPFEILRKEIQLDEQGKKTENWDIKALSLRHWMDGRMHLPEGNRLATQLDIDADIIMLTVLSTDVTRPENTKRALKNMKWGNFTSGIGKTKYRFARFTSLLTGFDEITELSGVRWNIGVSAKDKWFLFNTYATTDRTYSQNNVSPVVFSPEFKTIQKMEYTENNLDYKTTAIVAGQGEGTSRIITTVNDEAEGFDRIEMFVDARDIADTEQREVTVTEFDEEGNETTSTVTADVARPLNDVKEDLNERGSEKLSEHTQTRYFSAQVQNSKFVYGVDWFVGDMVTVEHRGWNLTLDARVTEVLEVHEAGKPYEVEVVFDRGEPTLLDKLGGAGSTNNYYAGPSHTYVNQQISKADIIESYTFIRNDAGAVTTVVGDVDTQVQIHRDASGSVETITDASKAWNRVATYGFERLDGSLSKVNVNAVPIVSGEEEV